MIDIPQMENGHSLGFKMSEIGMFVRSAALLEDAGIRGRSRSRSQGLLVSRLLVPLQEQHQNCEDETRSSIKKI